MPSYDIHPPGNLTMRVNPHLIEAVWIVPVRAGGGQRQVVRVRTASGLELDVTHPAEGHAAAEQVRDEITSIWEQGWQR